VDGGQTPEELETLLEDAILLGDADAVAGLFQPGGMLVVRGAPQLRGRGQIRDAAVALCLRRPGYLAGPRRVFQVRDVALLLGRDVVNLARRGADGTWRYDICVLLPDQEGAPAPH
jgi:uncharacterized protein (TIGR02246 family)